MARIIVFTGKGGVGKTSVAAAHARYSALEGKKTLIVSTDMAHNLSDIFELSLGKDIKEVLKNLYALEIDPNYMMENDFKYMKEALINMINTSGVPLLDAAQISVFPGMDELFSLLKIMEIYEEGKYENIIVDCAPTGETLALLKFPELLSWYMEKFFPIGKLAISVLSPISKAVFKVQLPNREAMTDIEKMYIKLISLQNLLKNDKVTSIRLVTIPEKMVVEETKRNFMYMNLYNFNVDAVFINRILPKDIDNPFFNEWIELQNQYINEIEDVFTDIPIYKIPWFESDLNGFGGIDRIVQNVMIGKDFFKPYENKRGEVYEKLECGYKLKLHLPNISKEEVKLHETDKNLIIKIGNFKRNIVKPSSLRDFSVNSAKFENDNLFLEFKPSKEGSIINEH